MRFLAFGRSGALADTLALHYFYSHISNPYIKFYRLIQYNLGNRRSCRRCYYANNKPRFPHTRTLCFPGERVHVFWSSPQRSQHRGEGIGISQSLESRFQRKQEKHPRSEVEVTTIREHIFKFSVGPDGARFPCYQLL